MLHGQKEVSFVSIIMFTLCPDALSLNGSVMIINQPINRGNNYNVNKKKQWKYFVCYNIYCRCVTRGRGARGQEVASCMLQHWQWQQQRCSYAKIIKQESRQRHASHISRRWQQNDSFGNIGTAMVRVAVSTTMMKWRQRQQCEEDYNKGWHRPLYLVG